MRIMDLGFILFDIGFRMDKEQMRGKYILLLQ